MTAPGRPPGIPEPSAAGASGRRTGAPGPPAAGPSASRGTAWTRLTDRLVAPGATRGEITISLGAAAVGAALASVLALRAPLPWPACVVLALVAFDLFGGAVVNSTRSAKRWYHRPGRTARHHLLFVAAHGQPFLLAWAVPGYGWTTALLVYVSVAAAAVLVTVAPAPLRRPVAFALTALVLVLVTGPADVPDAVAWFAPLLLVKLLLAHLLPEADTGSDAGGRTP
ncbi:hypothetical protein ACIP93_17450 [Streptomyces sp. NPDC088745]|uniref:hypothetical protein n=1 Tax=Streptomyces sp. NPDC088745 TaxID=3365884 RepID=UPI003820120C